MHRALSLVLTAVLLASSAAAQDRPAAPEPAPPRPIDVLIVDGQNNHDWAATTASLRATLAATGRFRVDVSMSPARDAARSAWDRWRPDFASADVIVVDYNGAPWPERVREAFTSRVRGGGGVVFVHAANNAFPGWKEYNRMIGLGWRGSRFGRRLTIDGETGEPVITPRGEGPGAGHGPQHAFLVTVRRPEHPIMKGLPATWMHARDELYHGQRGPAEDMTVLSSAFSAEEARGTGAHEPMTWVIPYGRGRCVTMVMGHHWRGQKDFEALHCVGFRTVFARAVEWAATEDVTIPVPGDFPTAEKTSVRAPVAR